jgi:hypothetical protein
MRLPFARFPQKEDRFGPGDVGPGGEFPYPRLGQMKRLGKVETLQRLDQGEPRLLDPAGGPALLPFPELSHKELSQKLNVGYPMAARLLGQSLGFPAHARKLQLFAQCGDLGGPMSGEGHHCTADMPTGESNAL